MAGLDPTSLSPIGIGASVLQTGLGVAQAIGGAAKIKKLQAQRKAYEIPEGIQKILNASYANAQGDTTTQNYQTNLIEQQGAAAIGGATRLGGDPNTLSAIFGQQIGAIGQAAQTTHASKMQAFSQVLAAENLMAENEAARQKSEQDIIKDQIQSQAAIMQSGLQNIAGGVNTAIATDSAARQAQLYKDVAAKNVPIVQNVVNNTPSVTPVTTQSVGWKNMTSTQKGSYDNMLDPSALLNILPNSMIQGLKNKLKNIQ